MKTAIYPGSFDPVTLGHLNIIKRAAQCFDRVIVCVMVNSKKHGLFTPEERVELLERCTARFPNVEVDFSDELLAELLRIFNNSALDDVGGDVIGRIYEYFLNKFAKNIAQDDGVFFTPKSLVKMIVNILEPREGILLDPACGSGGMFVQTGDFVEHAGMLANNTMTFYGQEKVEYNAQLCLMNLAVHGLSLIHI